MKPRSSMRSASSRTKRSAVAIDSSRVFIRSRTRPGVPMTMSAPRRIASHWRNRLAPPMITTVRIRAPAVRMRIASSICSASSRVGARISARVWNGPGRRGSASRWVRIGSENANVLPLPVCAMPKQILALQQRRDGIGLDWGGDGEIMRVSACSNVSGRPRPAKVTLVTRDECSSTSHAGACCPCPSVIQWGRTVGG